ncbi:MAG: rod shape-determining protein MreD [Planctomycetota bacterium]|nr:rod shape-determining protein MreD [Planctomycetota bacterium]
MMKACGSVLLVLFVVAFQAATVEAVRIDESAPHFVCILVAFFGLFAARGQALLVAAVAGLLLDFLSVDPWGSSSAPLILLSHFLWTLRRAGWTERPAPRAVAIGAGLALVFASRGLLLWLLEGFVPPWRLEAGSLVYTLAFAWPLFAVLARWRPVVVVAASKRYY